jgi:hypothetical protein
MDGKQDSQSVEMDQVQKRPSLQQTAHIRGEQSHELYNEGDERGEAVVMTQKGPKWTALGSMTWKTSHPVPPESHQMDDASDSRSVTIEKQVITFSENADPEHGDRENFSFKQETLHGITGYSLYDHSHGKRVSFLSSEALALALARSQE